MMLQLVAPFSAYPHSLDVLDVTCLSVQDELCYTLRVRKTESRQLCRSHPSRTLIRAFHFPSSARTWKARFPVSEHAGVCFASLGKNIRMQRQDKFARAIHLPTRVCRERAEIWTYFSQPERFKYFSKQSW